MQKQHFYSILTFIALAICNTLLACESDINYHNLKAYTYKYKGLIPLYEISLESPAKINSSDIFNGANAFKIEFNYLRKIKENTITNSANKALIDNLDKEELNLINPIITKLHKTFTNVKKGDKSTFTYCPKHGTRFFLNKVKQIEISDALFPTLYFLIWFGDNPLSEDLKQAIGI